MKYQSQISWALRIIVAIIYLQTLYYKFTAHPESVYIFSKLGVEPYGRIGLGVVELITAVLILLPSTKLLGMLLSLGIITGALVSHFLVIGTNVQGDSGTLFILAVVVLVLTIILIFIHKNEFSMLLNKTKKM